MEWDQGNRYGNVEDRRGMGGIGLAGGGIGAAVLGLIGYFVFGINPLIIMRAEPGGHACRGSQFPDSNFLPTLPRTGPRC